MNMIDWANSVKNSQKRLAIPIMTHPGIDIIGKKVIDAVTDGEVHAASIIALNKRYPSDGVTAIMDLTVEAEAFGCQIRFEDNEVPNVIGRLVSNMAEVEALKVPDISCGRVPEYLKANRLVAAEIKDKPLFGGAIGPFSLAGRLFDMTEIMIATFIEPETIHLLLSKCTKFIKMYLKEMKAAGCNGVMIAEPAAGLLSNEDSMTYSTKYVKEIVDELQDENFMVVLHNCGNTGGSTDAMIASGAAGLHFGNKIDMIFTLKECPEDIVVMGNLDPVSLFKQGNAEMMSKATKELLDNSKNFKNFVISSGCDVPPGIPEENILAFYNEVNKYNKQ